ncbi:MAG: hypothetical protein QXY51_00340 [Candidatus Bathyarchaeia archaeon]
MISILVQAMSKEDTIKKIEENILKRVKTDRLMWFSMWFLACLVTFGAALFPMIYLLVERRNRHFSRQRELESLLIAHYKLETSELPVDVLNNRNALMWAISSPTIAPIFIIAYFLSRDLIQHNEHQRILFEKILGNRVNKKPLLNIKRCITITVVTLGLGIIYWLYEIFNAYNRHFKEQWMLEDEILKNLKMGN